MRCLGKCKSKQCALFRTRASSWRSGRAAGDEGLASRLTVLCFCAINIVYGSVGDGYIHLKRGKKKTLQTHTLENFRKLPKCSNPSRGQWFFNRSLHDKSLQRIHLKNNNPAAAWNNSTPTSAAYFEKSL